MFKICLLAGLLSHGLCAAEIAITGVDGPARANIEGRLDTDSLEPRLFATPDGRRLLENYLAREAREALEPFGYYQPMIAVTLATDPDGRHVIDVDPGPPTRVTSVQISFSSDALDAQAQDDLAALMPLAVGDRLVHRAYEQGKADIQAGLIGRGHVEAFAQRHEVRVDRAAGTAEIILDWHVGPVYFFGPVQFTGSQLDPEFMQRYITFAEGDRFATAPLELLRRTLIDTQYFGQVLVEPLIDAAIARHIPIRVSVRPNERNLYELGVQFGTDSGFGVQLDYARRWVNDRGHRLRSSLTGGSRRQTLELAYTIPKPDQRRAFYAFGFQLNDRETDSYEYQQIRASASYSHLWREFGRTDSISALDEDYTIGPETGRVQLLLAKFGLSRVWADDELAPRRGRSIATAVEVAAEALGSDTDLLQLTATWREIWPAGAANRLLLRVEGGSTLVDSVRDLPASLRFFTGGDRSIRGFAFESLGPEDDTGTVIGGRHLLVGSLEFEHALNADWRVATFVDAGNAFNRSEFDVAVGAGVGVRYMSPIGPIRLDLAQALSDDDLAPRIHLVIGPDL